MLILYFIIIFATVLIDQLIKIFISGNYEVGESTDLIPGVFRLTYVQNKGAAFGMLADKRWVFLILSTVAIIAIVVYVIKTRPDNKWLLIALALITSGGIGNMIDRIRLKYVIDMFDFYLFGKYWVWVFNFADACVCVGAAMLAIWLLKDTVKEYKKEKSLKEAGKEASSDSDSKNNG